jgi:hypothetical protein
MTSPAVAGWRTPPGHPVVVLGNGPRAGAACGCGDWQAYLPDVPAALAARRSYEEHLDRAAPGWRASSPPG